MGKGYRSPTEKEKYQLELVSNHLNGLLPNKDIAIPTLPASQEAINAGDLVSFFYNGSLRTGLVVRSKRAPTGTFKSKNNNNLLNIYEVSLDVFDSSSNDKKLTQDTVQIIMKNLYRNRVACTYKYSNRVLSNFLGFNNFKTFSLNKMDFLTQIMITLDESIG